MRWSPSGRGWRASCTTSLPTRFRASRCTWSRPGCSPCRRESTPRWSSASPERSPLRTPVWSRPATQSARCVTTRSRVRVSCGAGAGLRANIRDRCRFEQRGDPAPLAPDAQVALFRSAQEALTNVAKHADASQVDVCLCGTRNRDAAGGRTTARLTAARHFRAVAMGCAACGSGPSWPAARCPRRVASRCPPMHRVRRRAGGCRRDRADHPGRPRRRPDAGARGSSLMLGLADGIEVVGVAADGEQAVAAVLATSPDVALLDLRMPRVDGVEATRQLRGRPRCRGRGPHDVRRRRLGDVGLAGGRPWLSDEGRELRRDRARHPRRRPRPDPARPGGPGTPGGARDRGLGGGAQPGHAARQAVTDRPRPRCCC